MYTKTPTTTSSRGYLRKHLPCPLRRHCRTIVLDVNSNTLASQSHSSRRARAWQKRAASTVQTTSSNRLPLGTPRTSASRLPLPPQKPLATFCHVTTIPADEISDRYSNQRLPHEPYVASPPGPSPRSSQFQLPQYPDDTRDMPSSDPSSEDRVRLAELATAKLERQSQRILDNDPTMPAPRLNKSRTAHSKVPKAWKSFPMAESSDDNASLTDGSRKASPLNVKAKAFLPSSRESSLSRGIDTMRKDSAYLSSNDDDDFQLVTNKKAKASSKPALGLNAYEIKADDKPSAIAAPFNKREINEVFGNDLPVLDFFQRTVGARDGQVHFAMHPNGDVSAQQWSQGKYQWVNIGQFSNIRKRTEGSLASRRLKGETELHNLRQNTLFYFRAVAKQEEATAMGLPFGPKELQDAMPNVPIERGTGKKVDPILPGYQSPTFGFPASNPGSIADSEQTSLDTPVVIKQPWEGIHRRGPQDEPKIYFSSNAQTAESNPFNPHFLSALTVHDVSSCDAYDKPPKSLTALNNLSFGTFPTAKVLPSADRGFKMPAFETPKSKSTEVANDGGKFADPASSNKLRAARSQAYTASVDYSSFLEKAQSQTETASQAVAVAQRDFVKACLNRLSDNALARGSAASNAARTVLYDPFRIEGTKDEPDGPSQATPSGISNDAAVWVDSDPTSSTPTSHPPVSPYIEPSLDLRISEPEPGWKDRPVEIVNINLPYMSNEDLALYSRPTPQNWDGPFFVGSPDRPSEANVKSPEEELHDWFHGGNNVQRQEDFYQRIKTAHDQTMNRASSQYIPGPVGSPSAFSTRQGNREIEAFNETTTRLLIPVLENLSQYVEGPTDKRHGYFAPFGPPPEWCIDKSPNGNNSFFGEDWGQAPERIGRDARYRRLPFEGKFGSFEPQYGGGMGGSQSYTGRFRYSPAKKF